MSRPTFKSFFAGAFLLLTLAAPGIPAGELDDSLQRARSLAQQGRDGEAITLYEATLKVARDQDATAGTLGVLLNELAGLHHQQQEYERAEELYREASRRIDQAYGDSHPNLAAARYNLGRLLHETGRLEEAATLMEQARANWRISLGGRHPHTLLAIRDLAAVYADQRRYEEAEELLGLWIRLTEQDKGRSHPDLVPGFNALAGIYEKRGRDVEAEAFYGRSLALLKRAGQNIEAAEVLGRLAGLNARHERSAVAERLYKQALDIYRDEGRGEHGYGATLNALADLLVATDRAAEAQALREEANAATVGARPAPAPIQVAEKPARPSSQEPAPPPTAQPRPAPVSPPPPTEVPPVLPPAVAEPVPATPPPSPAPAPPPAPEPVTPPPPTVAPPTAAPPPPKPAPEAAWRVQVASRPTTAEAEEVLATLRRDHGDLVGETGAVIREADLGDRGIWHRIQLGPLTRTAARELCADLKKRGQDCLVIRSSGD